MSGFVKIHRACARTQSRSCIGVSPSKLAARTSGRSRSRTARNWSAPSAFVGSLAATALAYRLGSRQLGVAGVLLAGIAIGTYLGFTTDSPDVNEPFEIKAAFRDTNGIRPQSPVRIDGVTERVGFYNTFVARVPLESLDAAGRASIGPDAVALADPQTGDVHLVAGPHYRGIQFHAESILTQNGFALIHRLVRDLLT